MQMSWPRRARAAAEGGEGEPSGEEECGVFSRTRERRLPPVLRRGGGYSTVLDSSSCLPNGWMCRRRHGLLSLLRLEDSLLLLLFSSLAGRGRPHRTQGPRAKGARRPRCARRVPRREGPHQGPPRARSRYARATAAGHAGELRAGGCERRHRRGGVRRVTTMGGSRLVLYIGSVLQQCSCCNCLLFMLQSLLRMLSFDVANM
jgi:hypothetical protein